MQIGSCSLSSWGGATPKNMTYFLLQCSALKCDWLIQTNDNVDLNSSVLHKLIKGFFFKLFWSPMRRLFILSGYKDSKVNVSMSEKMSAFTWN